MYKNVEMGYIFEELIRRFSEYSEAGDHYTLREVIKLMVNLLFMEDTYILTKLGITQILYDCCAGTGGMGFVAKKYLEEIKELEKSIMGKLKKVNENFEVTFIPMENILSTGVIDTSINKKY